MLNIKIFPKKKGNRYKKLKKYNNKMNLKKIDNIYIVERDLDSFPCPTEEELKTLITSFDYYDKYRVLIELMVLTGARVGEIVKAKYTEFTEDFSIWKYKIQKPIITIKYNTTTNETLTVVDYKVRTVQLPDWFAEKMKNYFEINKLSISAGFLFYSRNHKLPYISTAQVRAMFVKKRKSLNLNRLWKIVVKNSTHIREQYNQQNWYALSPHGLRRYYVSEMFIKLMKHGVQNALTMIGKLLGHTKPLHTTNIYLSPRVVKDILPTTYDPELFSNIKKYEPKIEKEVYL